MPQITTEGQSFNLCKVLAKPVLVYCQEGLYVTTEDDELVTETLSYIVLQK